MKTFSIFKETKAAAEGTPAEGIRVFVTAEDAAKAVMKVGESISDFTFDETCVLNLMDKLEIESASTEEEYPLVELDLDSGTSVIAAVKDENSIMTVINKYADRIQAFSTLSDKGYLVK